MKAASAAKNLGKDMMSPFLFSAPPIDRWTQQNCMRCPIRAHKIGEVGVSRSIEALKKTVFGEFRWYPNHHEMQETSPEEISPGDRFQMSYSNSA